MFVISGLFAALAGVLFALNYRQVHPFMGEALGLKGISAMVVGGMGNIWGAIAGGLIIGMAEALSIRFFGADFVDISVYGLLLLHPDRSSDRAVRRVRGESARMSGYLRRRAVLLAINVVYAYGAFLPIAAGQLNLGVAGFAGDRRLCSAFLSNKLALSPLIAIPLGWPCRWSHRACRRNPGVAHTRHLSRARHLCAGEIVRAAILNLEVVGGAAGYPVTLFMRLADGRAVRARRHGFRLAAVCDPVWHRDHRRA